MGLNDRLRRIELAHAEAERRRQGAVEVGRFSPAAAADCSRRIDELLTRYDGDTPRARPEDEARRLRINELLARRNGTWQA